MRAALAGRAGQSISHLHPLGILALTSMILVHTGVGLREATPVRLSVPRVILPSQPGQPHSSVHLSAIISSQHGYSHQSLLLLDN